MKFFKKVRSLFFCCIPSLLVGQDKDTPISAITPVSHPSLRECDALLKKAVSSSPRWGFKCTWLPSLEDYGLTQGIDFEVQSKNFTSMTVCEAEKVYAELAEHYLQRINNIKIIRPFLKEFPVDVSQLKLSVVFRNAQVQQLPQPNIAGMTFRSVDSIEYAQYTKFSDGPYRTVVEKSVFNIPVLKHLCSLPVPRTREAVKQVVPSRVLRKEECAPAGFFIQECGLKFAKEKKLTYLIGGDGEWEYALGFNLIGTQKVLLDEARVLASNEAKNIFSKFNKSKIISARLKEHNKVFEKYSKPLSMLHLLTFRIAFWDEDINRQEAPYIAEIRFVRGVFKYFTADEGQRLVLVHEETYGEAMKFLEERSSASSQE